MPRNTFATPNYAQGTGVPGPTILPRLPAQPAPSAPNLLGRIAQRVRAITRRLTDTSHRRTRISAAPAAGDPWDGWVTPHRPDHIRTYHRHLLGPSGHLW